MYGHSQTMNVRHHNPADDEDEGAVGDPIDHHLHHHMSYEDGSAAAGIVVEDVSSDSVYVSGEGAASDLAGQRADVSSQLTLTFRGQVYVFDAVTPEKVQAVLLLLGGCELTSGQHGLEAAPQSQRVYLNHKAIGHAFADITSLQFFGGFFFP
uniref:GATA transcription factor 25 n=1 Tax=Rhizophora mucronata TaxID=61149 RepID=A0A2P2JT39_RHIMU